MNEAFSEVAALVDSLRDEFEAAWHGEDPPTIRDYLARVPEDVQRALFVELLTIEWQLRNKSGEIVRSTDYEAVFPQYADVVGTVAARQALDSTIVLSERFGQEDSDDVTLPPQDEHATTPTGQAATTPSGQTIGRPSGRRFGDYEVLDEIARGGMGVVYRARQLRLNRIVALKMILSGDLAGDEEIQRFHVEAEAAANLRHPGIVPIYEVGEHDSKHYFSMGFIEGESLSRQIAEGPLEPRRAATLTRQICEAIVYAHGQGVIHRDLKPANVLLDENGDPHVTDFGLAKRVKGDSELTSTGQILGTPSYMPPEQAGGNPNVGPAADIYALGAILYTLLTGRPPFQAANVMDILLQVIDKEPVSPRQLNPQIDKDLETICLKCLEKTVDRRYSTAHELSSELQRYLNGQPINARPIGRVNRAWRWCRRNPVGAALATTLALLIVLSTIGATTAAWWYRRVAENEEGLRKEVEQRESRLQADLYLANLWQGSRELSQGAPDRAIDWLTECPPHLRGWEWNLLNRLTHEEPTTLYGHPELVLSLDFSSDSRWLATGSSASNVVTSQVRLWDVADPRSSRVVPGMHDPFVGFAFHRDEHQLVSSDAADGLKFCSADGTGATKHIKIGHGRLSEPVFDLEGHRIFVGAASGAVLAVAADSGAVQHIGEGHSGAVVRVALSSDGTRLASASWDGTVRLWDTDRLSPVCTLAGHAQDVLGVAFHPNGRYLASTGSDRSLRLWEVESGRLLWVAYLNDTGWNVAFHPQGDCLVSCGGDGVGIWDITSGRQSAALRGHEGTVHSLAFSPDGRWLATGGADWRVLLWDGSPIPANTPPPETQPLVHFDKHSGPVTAVSFLPDGKGMVSAAETVGQSAEVAFWNRATEQVNQPLDAELAGNVRAMAVSPDGRWLALGGSDRAVQLWDLEQNKMALLLRGHEGSINALAFHPTGNRLASGATDQTVRLWSLPDGRPLEVLGPLGRHSDGAVVALAWDRTGATLAVGASLREQSSIVLWEPGTGYRRIANTVGSALAWSPNDARLLFATPDSLSIWDEECHSVWMQVEPLSQRGVDSVVWSPDGQSFAVGFRDGTIRVWDARTAEPVSTLRGHLGPVSQVVYDEGGNTLASAGHDQVIRLWPAPHLAETPSQSAVDRAIWRHRRSAVRLLDARQHKEALIQIGAALALGSEHSEVWFRKGQVHEHLEQWSEAEQAYARAVERKGEYSRAWNNLGWARMQLEKWSDAEEAFDRALTLTPRQPLTLRNRGVVRGQLGRFAESARDFAAAHRLAPDYGNAWLNHARACLADGDMEGYRAVCAELQVRFGESEEGTHDYALEVCLLHPDLDANWESLVRRAQRRANDVPNRLNFGRLAWVLYRAGRHKEALAAIARAIEFGGPLTTDLILMALLHGQLENTTEVENWLPRARDALASQLKSSTGWVERLSWELLQEELDNAFAAVESDR